MTEQQTPIENENPEPTKDPEAAAPVEAPKAVESFTLDELEKLRLLATNEKLRRTVAELQLLQMQAAQLQGKMNQLREAVEEAGKAQEKLLTEVGDAHGVGAAIRRFDIDLNEGMCTLRKVPPQPPQG